MRKGVTIAEVFEHKGKLCVILFYNRFVPKGYHNGYVEITEKTWKNVTGSDIYNFYLSEEVTFYGTLDEFPNIKFLGFDTVHYCDKPHTQNLNAVRNRTIKFCEMVKKQRL